jgi:hypothetical protein
MFCALYPLIDIFLQIWPASAYALLLLQGLLEAQFHRLGAPLLKEFLPLVHVIIKVVNDVLDDLRLIEILGFLQFSVILIIYDLLNLLIAAEKLSVANFFDSVVQFGLVVFQWLSRSCTSLLRF